MFLGVHQIYNFEIKTASLAPGTSLLPPLPQAQLFVIHLSRTQPAPILKVDEFVDIAHCLIAVLGFCEVFDA